MGRSLLTQLENKNSQKPDNNALGILIFTFGSPLLFF